MTLTRPVRCENVWVADRLVGVRLYDDDGNTSETYATWDEAAGLRDRINQWGPGDTCPFCGEGPVKYNSGQPMCLNCGCYMPTMGTSP